MAGYSVTYTVVDNATKQIDAINRRIAQMRAPLDRMQRSVQRFVDVSGLRKVATGFDWIYKAAGSVLRTLTAIVPVMGAITGAASIAGMVKLVRSYSEWSRELQGAADNIGMTTQELQKFQDATRLAGGNADDMTSGLKSLHDKLGDLNIGRGSFAETAQMLEHLGVNFRDANGHIKTNVSELMPELIRKLAAIKDPLDRARMAQGLLGESGEKLVETFRQSSQSFAQWFTDVDRYKTLTDDQKGSLQRFAEAQGRLGVAFDRLGEQISAMVARDFGPLLQRFAEFVEKHTPEILAAIDQLSTKFAAWIGGIDWSKVEAGVNSFIDSLKWVVTHLDTIKDVAEGIAILFATKWAIGIVANIATVVGSLGTLSAALAPVVAALALVGVAAGDAYIKQREESEAKKQGFEKKGGSWWNPMDKIPHWVNPKTGETLTENQMRARLGADPDTGFSLGNMPSANATPQKPASDEGALDKLAKQLYDRAMKGPAEVQPGYRPPGAIQRQSATGGYLPAGVTPAAFHPGGGGALAGVASVGPSEFWDDMARAVTKGFEDAFDHITGFGGGEGGGGGFQQAAFHPGGGFGGGGSPNIRPASIGSPLAPAPTRAPGAPIAPLGAAGGKSAFYDEQRKLIYDAAVKANLPHPEVVAEVGATQAVLESGGGTRTPGGFNVYGIKSGGGVGGAGAPVSTEEEGPGGRYRTQASFATFQSKEDAADAYIKFLQINKRHYAGVLAADTVEKGLQAQGTSGYATASNYLPSLQDIHRQYGGKVAPPVTVPPPQPPNGAVDVNITHKNPPPNSAVTASGSGAVNVAPVRVEHQNMADI